MADPAPDDSVTLSSTLIREKASRGTLRETKRTYLRIRKEHQQKSSAFQSPKAGDKNNVATELSTAAAVTASDVTGSLASMADSITHLAKRGLPFSFFNRPSFTRSLTATERLRPSPSGPSLTCAEEPTDLNNNNLKFFPTAPKSEPDVDTDLEKESASLENFDRNMLELQTIFNVTTTSTTKADSPEKILAERDLSSVKASDLFTSHSCSSKLNLQDFSSPRKFRRNQSLQPPKFDPPLKNLQKLPPIITTPPMQIQTSNSDFAITHSSLASLPESTKSKKDKQNAEVDTNELTPTNQHQNSQSRISKVKKLTANFETILESKNSAQNQNSRKNLPAPAHRAQLSLVSDSNVSVGNSSTFDFNANTASQVNIASGENFSKGEVENGEDSAFNVAILKMEKDQRISKWLRDI